jgi:hypothetical protein
LPKTKKGAKISAMQLEQLAKARAGEKGRSVELRDRSITLKPNEVLCLISPAGVDWTLQRVKKTIMDMEEDIEKRSKLAEHVRLITDFRCVNIDDGYSLTYVIGTVTPDNPIKP